MIGVVVPAHDEQQRLPACLDSLAVAAGHPGLRGEAVAVVVVADACRDATAAVARAGGAGVVTLQARCVGRARAAGALRVLSRGARWLANTDADSVVAPDWLAVQVRLARAGADAVCGTVEVDSGSRRLDSAFRRDYADRDGHRHVHGANLGVSAAAYRAAGGWRSVPLGEDVLLVADLQAAGARIAWSARARVRTSARLRGRASGGFADHLASLQR